MPEQDRADLLRAARYLESNNDEDSTMSVLEAERIAATLRRLAGTAGVPVAPHQTERAHTPTGRGEDQ